MEQEKLTGKRRYRIGAFGKVILQVEFVNRYEDPMTFTSSGLEYTYWRDAALEDISENSL